MRISPLSFSSTLLLDDSNPAITVIGAHLSFDIASGTELHENDLQDLIKCSESLVGLGGGLR